MSTQDMNPEHGLDARRALIEIGNEQVHIPTGALEAVHSRRGINHRGVSNLRQVVARPSAEVRQYAVERGASPYTPEATMNLTEYDPVAGAQRMLDIENAQREHQAMGEGARASIAAMPSTTPTIETAPTQAPVAPPQSEVATQVDYVSRIADDRYFPGV